MLPGMTPIVSANPYPPAPGQQLFTANGTFTVPSRVTSISVVAVGRGADSMGRGGDLRWMNEIAVTPGESLTVSLSATVGAAAILSRGGTQILQARGGSSGTSTATGGNVGGGNGGAGGTASGGGGAGGYSGNGGNGNVSGNGSGTNGNGGGGGGGGGNGNGSGGGGVGLLGEGVSGAGAANTGGLGGSGGTKGATNGEGGAGGEFGGGGGGGSGGASGIRIIWGEGRAFPSTNTGDV